MDLKAPAWGLAAAGAALGLTVGPFGVVVLATIGGALDVLRAGHRRTWASMHPLDEHKLRAVRPLAPHLSDEVLQYKAAISRPTGPAAALYKFLHQHVNLRVKDDFWEHDKTRAHVGLFQRAFNKDRGLRMGVHALPEDGVFDRRTAAALSLYAKRPVSSDPGASG